MQKRKKKNHRRIFLKYCYKAFKILFKRYFKLTNYYNSLNFKNIFWSRKIKRYFNYIFNFKRLVKYHIVIKITTNNIFGYVANLNSKRVLLNRTAKRYNLLVSRRTLKYSTKIFLRIFFTDMKKSMRNKGLIHFIYSGPKKFTSTVFKALTNLKKKKKQKTFFFFEKTSPCFNGCRAKKYRFKKHEKNRLFK